MSRTNAAVRLTKCRSALLEGEGDGSERSPGSPQRYCRSRSRRSGRRFPAPCLWRGHPPRPRAMGDNRAPRPHDACRTPPIQPREWIGHCSIAKAAPAGHSACMPMPKGARNKNRNQKAGESRRLQIEYHAIEIINDFLRPIRSASQPEAVAPRALGRCDPLGAGRRGELQLPACVRRRCTMSASSGVIAADSRWYTHSSARTTQRCGYLRPA
jgi:hypothetical protein